MPHRTSFRALPLALACATLVLPAAWATTSCPAPGTLPEAPIALSSNQKYFTYKGATIALTGQSYEYLCHISQPTIRQNAYCTLEDYPSVLTRMTANSNNVMQLWAVFNASPGASTLGSPYSNDEQPFKYIPPTPPALIGKWDLSVINQTYLTNLETVVCNAYNKDIIVEVTLLDPWCPDWLTSPFKPSNTVDPAHQGFTQRGYFGSMTGDGTAQNSTTRGYQRAAVAAVVNRLKKYPNIIFEVANEPDFIPSAGSLGVSVLPADVVAWEKNIITTAITPNDTAHLLQINGHTSPAFAWSIGLGAKIDTLHYTQGSSSSVDGAITLMRDTTQTAARANYAIGFNETHVIPDTNSPARTADDVRSEAWEFAFYTGGLYDGYSTNFSDTEASNASVQLKKLASVLQPPVVSGGYPGNISNLAAMQQASCNGASDWCKNIAAWGLRDEGNCGGTQANIYWSTMKSNTDLALYIHHGRPRSQLTGQNGQDAYSAIACLTNQGTTPGYTTALQYQVGQVGCWAEVWRDPKTLAILAAKLRYLDHANQWYSAFNTPAYAQDVFFFVSLYNLGQCPF